MSKHHHATGFPPVSTPQSRWLILGSMPGLPSLGAVEYYAHPQNVFWRIMADIFKTPIDGYEQRLSLIRDHHLALWDVLEYCEREGSLDARIKNDTIRVNDFKAFFKQHPLITHVFFNGTKAESEFRKRVMPTLGKHLILVRLPSTSPAMAGASFADKCKAWRIAFRAAGV